MDRTTCQMPISICCQGCIWAILGSKSWTLDYDRSVATQFWHWAVSVHLPNGMTSCRHITKHRFPLHYARLTTARIFPTSLWDPSGGRSAWFGRAQSKQGPGGAQPWPRCAALTWPDPAWNFHARFFQHSTHWSHVFSGPDFPPFL